MGRRMLVRECAIDGVRRRAVHEEGRVVLGEDGRRKSMAGARRRRRLGAGCGGGCGGCGGRF
jgi:hypothetical protein